MSILYEMIAISVSERKKGLDADFKNLSLSLQNIFKNFLAEYKQIAKDYCLEEERQYEFYTLETTNDKNYVNDLLVMLQMHCEQFVASTELSTYVETKDIDEERHFYITIKWKGV